MKKTAYQISYIFLIIVLFIACSSIEHKNNKILETDYIHLYEHNTKWAKQLNDRKSLISLYDSSALMLFEDQWYHKPKAIQDVLHSIQINKRFVRDIHQHSETQLFEVGDYVTSHNKVIRYLTAYTKKNGAWKRQLEVFQYKAKNAFKKEESDKIIAELEARWAKLIADKNAGQMVEHLFWDHARYYALIDGFLVKEFENLPNIYRFTEGENVLFTVDILDYYVISDEVIYTVGEYQTNNEKGRFTLILTKNKAGDWKITLDSNF